jgi:hypothetical protein
MQTLTSGWPEGEPVHGRSGGLNRVTESFAFTLHKKFRWLRHYPPVLSLIASSYRLDVERKQIVLYIAGDVEE